MTDIARSKAKARSRSLLELPIPTIRPRHRPHDDVPRLS
jgi:hypothetical protein